MFSHPLKISERKLATLGEFGFIKVCHRDGEVDVIIPEFVEVCSLLGYYEFLTPRRLSNVLQWQRSSGCYGNIENENDYGQHKSKRTMRKLLMGKELAGEKF